jgi:hypothetical protein
VHQSPAYACVTRYPVVCFPRLSRKFAFARIPNHPHTPDIATAGPAHLMQNSLRRITGASQLVALTARLLCCGVSVRSLRYFCRVHAACGMRAAVKLRMPAVVKMSRSSISTACVGER